MILIEIFSDSSKQMFLNVPHVFHRDLMSLYCKSLKLCVNKPQFVKVSSLELIRMKYIQEEFNAFDVEEILEDFTKFYYDLEKKELEKVKFGFEEDIYEFIWEYLNYN
jgi:hypothetical protein